MPVMRVCVRACAWYCVDSGMLADLGSNVKRAVQNNFADVYRQRVIDMVHGQETVGAKAHSRHAAHMQHPLVPGAERLSTEGGDDGGDGEEVGGSQGGVECDWHDEREQLEEDDQAWAERCAAYDFSQSSLS